MKKLALLLAFIASSAVLIPTASQARDRHDHSDSRRYASRCRSCGDSVYQERYCSGRDRNRRPVYSWRTMSHRCSSSHGHGHRHGSSHGRSTHISGPGFHFGFGSR